MVFVSLIASLIPQIEAVDYRDSTGYTPSWAKNSGYHSVLNRCNDLIGDTSRDGNWCYEWVAYVLDQGIENFPQSTKSTSSASTTSNLSERACTENKLCAFPGEFLKYRNYDTYDDFEEIAIVEFKEKINDNTIRVFIDGFGSKPLTYNLNLKTGIETHDEYKNVNRPFNLLEPIPMKIGQQVNQIIEGSYGSTISAEQTTNLKDGGGMDIVRTVMGAQTDLGNGDVEMILYDKETGIQINYIEKYELDGKQYYSGMILIDTNIFSIPTKISSTKDTSTPKNIESLVITPKESLEPVVERVPNWIRNNAEWWAEGAISDGDFTKGIQYLIKEGIIHIPETVSDLSMGSNEIPSWIKNNADWWSQGLISDDDFLKGIQYLVEKGIIVLNEPDMTSQSEQPEDLSIDITPDKDSYSIGHDAIITLIDSRLNQKQDEAEFYDMDLITVKVNGNFVGTIRDWNPAPLHIRETGDNTGIFQIVIEIMDTIGNTKIQVGDVIEFEYEDVLDSSGNALIVSTSIVL